MTSVESAISFATAATTHELSNGLTAIFRPMASSEAVTVDIWIEAGGRVEPPELLGISHFLEHMVFKGTERIRPGELDFAIESRGGVANAVTSQDYTHYYITVAADDLEDALPYLAEAVTQASIPDDEFHVERKVVLEEIRRSHDNPDYCAYHMLAEAVYPNHPYSRPVLGTEDSLMGLTPDLMRQYHRNRYRPDRMVVVMVGNFQLESAKELIESHFGHLSLSSHLAGGIDRQAGVISPSISSSSLSSSSRSSFDGAAHSGIQRIERTQSRIQQARAVWAWTGVSIQQWDVACGLDVLASVLGDGRSSRLVKLLREENGWVQDVGISSAVHFDPGLFSVSAYLQPENISCVEAAVLAEIKRLHEEPISEAELNRVRRMLTNEFVFSTEATGQLARMYGFYHLCGGLELAERYLAAVQTVTAEYLMQLSREYLPLDRFCATVLKPDS